MRNINRLFNVVNNSLFTINGTLSYDRITQAITKLADTVNNAEEDENMWYIGEGGECTLDNLLVGAYWHYTEWHAGPDIATYKALCAIGNVFSPGMECPDTDDATYSALNLMATN